LGFLKRLLKKPKKAEVVERYWVETADGRRVLVARKLEAGEKIIARALTKEEVKQRALSLMKEKSSGTTFDELYDALRAEGIGESPAEFHDILLSLEEENLIESRFEAPNRLYYLKEKA
jgi:DNA-binding transcriptional ArsR family regulator